MSCMIKTSVKAKLLRSQTQDLSSRSEEEKDISLVCTFGFVEKEDNVANVDIMNKPFTCTHFADLLPTPLNLLRILT